MTQKLIVDIETTELKNRSVKNVWMVGTKDLSTGIRKNFNSPHLQTEQIQEWINGFDCIIGHNIIGFDSIVMQENLGIDFSNVVLLDTLVLSRLHNPQREGGHSLGSWGERLGFDKLDFEDWTKFSPEMEEYCNRDVDLTEKLYVHLSDKFEHVEGECVQLEHDVRRIITQQEHNGWLLDQRKCFDLMAQFKERTLEVEREVHRRFKPLPVAGREITPKFKKNGKLSVVGLKFLGDSWGFVCGPFSRVDWPSFNLGSRQQIARHLKFFGWKPKKFTEKGHTVVDEQVLENVKIPEAQLIAEYLLLKKRDAQVQSWVDAVEDDGRVHGEVNTNGAVTGRMTHSNPNMAQVPASYSPYGDECRSCWIVPEGYKLVGVDASGLELRMLAHYMNDEGYTNEILTGDIHTANQLAAGLETRDQAKTFIYAFLYGAGDAKIGSIAGGSAATGKKLKEQFLSNTPALKELRERIIHNAEVRGHLLGLDGRKLIIRSSHAAVNTLLQSAGAIIMKKALTLLEKYAIINTIEFKLVGNIHDEIQAEVPEEQADKFGWLAVDCIRAAGKEFNLNCPLDGNYKIGNNWKETH